MEGADPDHKSSEHWKEKYDKAISALENCEQSKKSLEKQHEELRRRDEDKRILCEKLTTEITILVEKCKLNEEVRGRLKDSKDELIQRMSKVENELSAEKETATQYEGRLEEKDATIKQLIEETVYLKEVNAKTVSKSKALEQLGIELNTAKEHLESKILLYETRIVEKDTEIEQLEKKLQFQSAVFEELQMTVVNMTGELSNLKGVLEENHQKKVKISQSLIDMRKSFTSKNEHLAEECYSQALELAKAYNDCDEYCRKIEELESALAGAQKESNIGMDISQEMLISREEDLKQVKNYNTKAKNKVAELEDQISNYRQEIQNLRSLITTERSTRLELEEQFDKRDAECKLLLKKMNMHEDEVQSLTNELDAKNQWNEMTGKSETERKQEAGSLGGVEEMRKQQTGGVKSVEVAGEDNKVKSELFKLRNECLVLAKRNEELKAENGWWSSIYEEAKADVEKLKQHVLMLQDNSTDIGPDGESISKIRIHYGVLKEERTKLKKAVDDLKLERYKLKNEIEDTKKSLWELKQEKEVSISMIDELEKKTMECTLERESMMKKAEQLEREYQQKLDDAERQWMVELEDKERFYENELKKRDANEIAMRQMEERLRQKESQSEIKTKEIKRILLQYSDLKSEKVRCEVRTESLQVAERTLSERVQTLESRVDQLEKREMELMKKLEEKEIEIRKLNEEWGKVAMESVTELKKAMSD